MIQPSPSASWLFWVAKQNYIISDIKYTASSPMLAKYYHYRMP